MKATRLVAAVLVLRAAFAAEQAVRITGRLVDILGDSLGNQSVTLKAAGSSKSFADTRTDRDGDFSFTAERGLSYEVIPEVPGFPHLVVPVSATRDETVNLGIIVLTIPMHAINVEPYMAPVPRTLDFAQKRTIPIRDRYANVKYGFWVDVPAGFIGEGIAPPAPNHGFVIQLGAGSAVWVDARYELPASPHVFWQFNARLGNLRAERRFWSDGSFHESMVARGFDGDMPIIYTIELETTPEYRADALRVFETLTSSFRTMSVRP